MGKDSRRETGREDVQEAGVENSKSLRGVSGWFEEWQGIQGSWSGENKEETGKIKSEYRRSKQSPKKL